MPSYLVTGGAGFIGPAPRPAGDSRGAKGWVSRASGGRQSDNRCASRAPQDRGDLAAAAAVMGCSETGYGWLTAGYGSARAVMGRASA